MIRLPVFLLTLGLPVGIAHAQSGATDSGSCASHLNTAPVEEVSLGALLNCLAEMQRDIQELKDAQRTDETDIRDVVQNEMRGIETGVTEAKVRDLIAGQGLPDRIVIASTVACDELGEGWQPFREATGRLIVGAGTETLRAYGTWDRQRPGGGVEPVPLTSHEVLATGGEETHALSEAELPAHRHPVGGQHLAKLEGRMLGGSGTRGDVRLQNDTRQSLAAGGGGAHNNMPPYIALHFCTKSG